MTNAANADYSIWKLRVRLEICVDDRELSDAVGSQLHTGPGPASLYRISLRRELNFVDATENILPPIGDHSPRLPGDELEAIVDIFKDPWHQIQVRTRPHDAEPLPEWNPGADSTQPLPFHGPDSHPS